LTARYVSLYSLSTQYPSLQMSSMSEQILRPIPRRMFELTPASAESSVPPSPAPENSNPEFLEVKTEKSYTPSKTRSILNLTSSTLLGIYSPTGYEASREDGSTPWGTGAQTPSHRRSVDDSHPLVANQNWDTAQPTTNLVYRRGGFRQYYFPLFLRGVLLFVFGMAYGTIIAHLHDDQHLAPIQVEGLNRHSWSYLIMWGLSGVAMGSLLPWVDILWDNHFGSKLLVRSQNRRRRASSSGSDTNGDERLSGRFNNGLGADWNPVVRSVGAFVGIAFAIVSILALSESCSTNDLIQRKLPWQSTLQVSLTLALANPVLWYLIDRSKTGFLLSTVVGIGGTLVLLGINPDIVPSPAASSPRAHLAGNESVRYMLSSRFPTNESIGMWTWIASVLFCSCVCFGNIGRRLALGAPVRKAFA
jgi:hypothetical protein